jgi:serine/threonine protein kinase
MGNEKSTLASIASTVQARQAEDSDDSDYEFSPEEIDKRTSGSTTPPTMVGWLRKKRRMRYFVLHGHTGRLSWYKSEDTSGAPCNSLSLAVHSDISCESGSFILKLRVPASLGSSHPDVFFAAKDYILIASTESECLEWAMAIRAVIKNIATLDTGTAIRAKKKNRTTTSARRRVGAAANKQVLASKDVSEMTESGEVVFNATPSVAVSRDDFILLNLIGQGSFGKVLQVQHSTTGKIYAMKVLRKEVLVARKQVSHTQSERSVLEQVSHPFIVKLHFAFQTAEKLYMILDYVNGGEVFFHLKREGRFSEARVAQYVAEIACALCHLHGQNIVYRDLKPENVLLSMTGHVVLTDFGLSKELDESGTTSTFCGTPEYLAPEILKGHPQTPAVDWWSLGTLTFEMLTGLPPFFCLAAGTRLLNDRGESVAVESVAVGDAVLGPDGRGRRVVRTSAGRTVLCRVAPVGAAPDDDRTFFCTPNHLLVLEANGVRYYCSALQWMLRVAATPLGAASRMPLAVGAVPGGSTRRHRRLRRQVRKLLASKDRVHCESADAASTLARNVRLSGLAVAVRTDGSDLIVDRTVHPTATSSFPFTVTLAHSQGPQAWHGFELDAAGVDREFVLSSGTVTHNSQNVNIMYQKILSGDLKFPSHVSPDARSVVRGLLDRDPTKRLGDTTIKDEAFFAHLDFADVEALKVPAEWVPSVADVSDVTQIDAAFTQQAAYDSDEDGPKSSSTAAKDAVEFTNFSYVDPSFLDTVEE